MNLDIFSAGKLQDFTALLNEFEGVGITDIRVIRERIHQHIYVREIGYKRERGMLRQPIARPAARPCPSCDTTTMMQVILVSQSDIVHQCKKCRYSEYVEVG